MKTALTIKVRSNGRITLPTDLCRRNNIQQGDILSIRDLGSAWVLSPYRGSLDEILQKLANQWRDSGLSLQSMLETLREVRQECLNSQE